MTHKSRIREFDFRIFHRNIYISIAKNTKAKVVGILFNYLIYLSAIKRAEELGFYVVAFYRE